MKVFGVEGYHIHNLHSNSLIKVIMINNSIKKTMYIWKENGRVEWKNLMIGKWQKGVLHFCCCYHSFQ